MQDLGALFIDDKSILVLYRRTKHGVSLKLRGESNKNWIGTTLPSESEYLKDNPDLLKKLQAGEVISI